MKKTAGMILAFMLVLSLFACKPVGAYSVDNAVSRGNSPVKLSKADYGELPPYYDDNPEPDGDSDIEETTAPEYPTSKEEKEQETKGIEFVPFQKGASPDSASETTAPTSPSDPLGSFMAANGKMYFIISLVVIALLASGIVYLLHKRRINSRQSDHTGDAAANDPQRESHIAEHHIPLKAVSVHHIGKRTAQEDSFGISERKDSELYRTKGVMAVVADGMGGLSGGENISSMAVLRMLQGFSDLRYSSTGEEELMRLLDQTVRDVNRYLEETVGLKKSGSTLMAVIICDDCLSWISVGDSRTALFRNGRLSDLNRRHIYGEELDEMVRQNQMTAAQAKNHPNRDKLTSYIGMGTLKYIDKSVRPLPLKKGDKIILMSDGVFNTLTDHELEQVLAMPTDSISKELENRILQKENPHQDNFTAVVLEILN